VSRQNRSTSAAIDGVALSRDSLVEMLHRMAVIRAFDSMLPELYNRGLVRGSSHAAIGQEAVAVGVCAGLEPSDYITSTHRGHGHTIAKGGDIKRMMAELLGRETGYCRGKGGSMHIADFGIGMLGANGIVGGGIGIAVGAGLSAAIQKNGRVAVCFFGEGALNQGVYLEAANLAVIWRLPVVFVCENNGFAMSARVERMTAPADLTKRGECVGMSAMSVDGMDVLAVHEAAGRATATARAGGGPSLVVAECYRFKGHFTADSESYRTKEEAEPWEARDPISTFATRLVEGSVLTAEEVADLSRGAEAEVAQALESAITAPLPSVESAWEDVYA